MSLQGFEKTGLGDRVATLFVRAFGKSTLGLAYGLSVAEALVAPAMPSTTARAGGIFMPIISSLALANGSKPGPPRATRSCHAQRGISEQPAARSGRRRSYLAANSICYCSSTEDRRRPEKRITKICLRVTSSLKNPQVGLLSQGRLPAT